MVDKESLEVIIDNKERGRFVGRLIVHRGSSFADKTRKYKVYCDSVKLGVVKDGEMISFDVPPGQHQIYFRIDWARSNKLVVNFSEGETEVVKVDSNLRGWKLLLALYYVTFGYHKYLLARH